MSELASILLTCAAAIALSMLALWLLSLHLRDASIVDIFWGLGFTLTAWVAFAAGGGWESGWRALCVSILTSLWGLRLAGYLLWRSRGHGEDPRYVAMRRRHGDRFARVSLFTVFGLQGCVMWVVSLPVQAVQAAPASAPGLLDAAGFALFGLGLGFEALGDAQLARFKANPDNAGRVMDRGLWAWTRHPNYFGDFCVWWGLFLFAVASGIGAGWSVLGPAVMSFFLMRVSGVPMLEKGMARTRPGYADYAARTPAFFPRPPRASRASAPERVV